MYLLLYICTFEVLHVGEGTVDWRSKLFSGSVKGFPSFDEATEILENLVDTYPSLVSRELIGNSFEGRDIYAYRIFGKETTNNPRAPKILLTSLLHGREPVTLLVALFVMGSLLEQYTSNVTETRYLLSTRELFVVPFMNPDAYALGSTRGNLDMRKNRRPTCAGDSASSGVDLNRNFDFFWSNSSSTCAIDYGGEFPFSEPESQALANFSRTMKFVSAMHLHSYGEFLTYPFNHPNATERVSESHLDYYKQLAQVMGFSKHGPASKTLKYATSGEATDWFYGELGTVALAPEIGEERSGFYPPGSKMKKIAEKNFQRIKYWIYKSGLEISAVKVSEVAGTEWRRLELVNTGLSWAGDWKIFTNCHEVSGKNLRNFSIPSNCPAGNDVNKVVCVNEIGLNCRCFDLTTREGHKIEFGTISNFADEYQEICVAGGVIVSGEKKSSCCGILISPLLIAAISLCTLFLIRIVVSSIKPA